MSVTCFNFLDQILSLVDDQWLMTQENCFFMLPVGGDVVGLGVSIYILWHVVQFDLPKSMLLRMVFNIAIDALVGSVPILGDLFDTTWKANTKNVNLLESHLQQPNQSRKADRRFLWLLFGGLLMVLLALIVAAAVVLTLVVKALSS